MVLFREVAEIAPQQAQIDRIYDPYHISYIACEALLARISLYMEDWDHAIEYSASVMEKVPLTSREKYIDMYRSSQAVPGEESIFRINHYAASSSLSALFNPVGGAKFEPAEVMNTLYEADDIRNELLTYVPQEGEEGIMPGSRPRAVCKYLWWKKGIPDDLAKVHDNFVLRCSEMYLIHAEALLRGHNDNTGAADDLKVILARAKGKPVSAITIPGDLAEAIKKERVRELCYEGHRLFDVIRRKEDLVRTNNSSVKLVSYPNYRFVLPLDQLEMQSNEKMIQNEGYETK